MYVRFLRLFVLCRFLPAEAASTAAYNEADMVYEAEDEKIPALPSVLTGVWHSWCAYTHSVHLQVNSILYLSAPVIFFTLDCLYDACLILPHVQLVCA